MKKIFQKKIFWYWGCIVSMLIIMTFLVPPFQKPDEPLHFKRAFALAMGQVTCRHNQNHERGFYTFPKSVSTFPDAMMVNTIIMKPEGKFPLALYRGTYPVNSSETVDLLYNCTLPFTGYIPHALGILLSMPLNNVLISFYAARIFGALFFLTTLYFCFRFISKRYRFVLLFCSVLPMVLQQVTAVSYDCVAIALGFILFALFTGYVEQKTVRIRDVLIFYGVLLLFLFTKPGFYLFSLLLIYLLQRVPMSLTKKMLLTLLFMAGVFGIALYSLTLPL